MRKMRSVGFRGVALALALLGTPAVWADTGHDEAGRPLRIARDAQGRIHSRITVDADGTRHTQAIEYWPEGEERRRIVDEDRDPAGHATRRTVREFDRQGRVHQMQEVTLDAAGQEHGTRTLFHYDASGHARTSVTAVGR